MWLDTCESSGANYSYFAYPGSKIYLYDFINTAKVFNAPGDIVEYTA